MPWWLNCYVGAVITAMVIATVQNVFCLDASAWASWIQAIGSIAAIFGTFALARMQWQKERARADAEARAALQELAKSVELLAEDARAAIEESSRRIVEHLPGKIFAAPTDRLKDAQFGLRSLLQRNLPTTIMTAIVILQRHVTYSIRAIEDREGKQTTVGKEGLEGAANRAQAARAECRHIAEFRRKLDATWG